MKSRQKGVKILSSFKFHRWTGSKVLYTCSLDLMPEVVAVLLHSQLTLRKSDSFLEVSIASLAK